MYKTFIVALAALTGSSLAKDIYVSPSGTGTGSDTAPYGSIQSAVNAAVAGDNILLRAGTYKVLRRFGFDNHGLTVEANNKHPDHQEWIKDCADHPPLL